MSGWCDALGLEQPIARRDRPGVSRELAEHRASTLSDLRYRLVFDIPDSRADPIRGCVTASFNVGEPGPIVSDFAQSAEMIGAV